MHWATDRKEKQLKVTAGKWVITHADIGWSSEEGLRYARSYYGCSSKHDRRKMIHIGNPYKTGIKTEISNFE